MITFLGIGENLAEGSLETADFANSANCDVSALLVPNFSFNYPGANTFKDIEFDILLSNPNVTSINLIW